MSEFESMSYKEKDKVRGSHDWPEIANYYNRYYEVIQHNVAEHGWRQKIGEELRGMVEYMYNTFVYPLPQENEAPVWGPAYEFYEPPGRKTKFKEVMEIPEVHEEEMPF